MNVAQFLTAYKAGQLTTTGKISITDTAANVQAAFDTIDSAYQSLGVTSIAGIVLTDSATPTLSIAYSDISNANKLPTAWLIQSPYRAVITGATISEAVLLDQDYVANTKFNLGSHAQSFVYNITDTAADLSANLGELQSLDAVQHLGAVTLTDGGIPTVSITADALGSFLPALEAVTSNYMLQVSVLPGYPLTGVTGHATEVTIGDKAANYSVVAKGDGHSFLLNGTGGSTTQMDNVTAIQYSDFTALVASQKPAAGSVSTAMITELYGAVFGRTPDIAGLAFYQTYQAAHPSTPFLQYATWFLSSPEYTSSHTAAETDAQFITDAYSNLLHRGPEAGAVDYYLSKVVNPIGAGSLAARAQVLAYFSQSPEFLSDVQITAAHPVDAQHWLYLV